MSVIGKMSVQSEQEFNNTYDKGWRVTLSVVCENQFMAHYHPENENVVFTRYSPSGSAELHFDSKPSIPKKIIEYDGKTHEVNGEIYIVYLRQQERPQIEDALFFSPMKCYSRTEYGTDLVTVELWSPYVDSRDCTLNKKQPRRVSIKLGIDNPGASNQFEPGTDGWWVVAYSANDMSTNEALALAHAS
jgi:hypothetical protein